MQVYCHATCATDTSNVSFVMDSVFDVVLKDNLRRMQKADLSKASRRAPPRHRSLAATLFVGRPIRRLGAERLWDGVIGFCDPGRRARGTGGCGVVEAAPRVPHFGSCGGSTCGRVHKIAPCSRRARGTPPHGCVCRARAFQMLDAGGGTGKSGVKTGAGVWDPSDQGKIILCAAFYTDNLSERKVQTPRLAERAVFARGRPRRAPCTRGARRRS